MKRNFIFLGLGILIILIIIFAVSFGVSFKLKNQSSQCYTNIGPSKYFKGNFYTIQENGVKLFIDDEFEIRKGIGSDSMKPTTDGSYLLIINPESKDDIKIGDIVSITRVGKYNLLHRVVDIRGDYYITKGDNNPHIDKEKWTYEDINGKVIGILY